MSEREPKPDWTPTRSQLARWYTKNAVRVVLWFVAIVLGSALYLVAATLLFHHRH